MFVCLKWDEVLRGLRSSHTLYLFFPNAKQRWLTKAVVSIMGQAKAVVARASVVSRDVDAVVNASSIIFTGTLIDICKSNHIKLKKS